MPKSIAICTSLLELLLNGVPIEGISGGETELLPALYVALHTGDPGADGDQETNEVDYPGYARVAVARDPVNKAWRVVDGVASALGEITFPDAPFGTTTVLATHASIGVADSGPGNIVYFGALEDPQKHEAAPITIAAGTRPILTPSATSIRET